MSYLGWLDIILIALGLGISVTPAYKLIAITYGKNLVIGMC